MSDLHELMARAMRAQGKVDPEEVFAEADATDLDDPHGVPYHGDDAEWEPLPDAEQVALEVDEEQRGYGYEP